MSESINTGTYQNASSGSGCGKALLWLFFIALILSCLCCAGFIGTGYYVANAIEKGYVEDPAMAQEKAVEAFGELNLPEAVKPNAFVDINLFGKNFGFASIYTWDVVLVDEDGNPIENSNSQGSIFFYSLSDFLKANEKEFVEGFTEGLTSSQNQDVTVKKVETVPITINGKTNDFTFSWMESSNKNPFLMVSGSFTAKTNNSCNVFLYLPGEPSLETVTEVLENIQ